MEASATERLRKLCDVRVALPPLSRGSPAPQGEACESCEYKVEPLAGSPSRLPCTALRPSGRSSLRPLPGSVYRDGKDFDTALVHEALDQSPSFGIVTIDGAEASLGTANFGPSPGRTSVAVTAVAHLRAHIKSRTRRGGQSAPRFGRTRDAEEMEFLQEVVERVQAQLGGVEHFILGGKADMKRKLLKELPPELQRRVLGVLDLNCGADRDSLRLAATKAQNLVDAPGQREASAAVAEFLEQVKLGGACYGPEQTLRALRLGAVQTLLVASSVEGSWSCALADALQVAEAQGVRCFTISADSQDSVRFCSAFGIGGLLRWDPAPEVLEEESDVEVAEEVPGGGDATPSTQAETDSEIGSTAPPEVAEALQWLTAQLTPLQGEADAEALREVAAVLLGDGLEPTLEVLRTEGVPEEVLQGFEALCCGIHVDGA